MNLKFFTLILLAVSGLFLANVVLAQVCPVCVVAIGAGLGLSRWLKIDDVVSSVWIGAFMVALTSWTLSFMKKKGWNFTDDGIVVTLAYLVLTYIPLYYAGIIGNPLNTIFGIDKIIFGSVAGSAMLFLANWLHSYLKKKNKGKSFFQYQRVVMPVAILILTSGIFYIIIKWWTI
jgi:hypothetical protein